MLNLKKLLVIFCLWPALISLAASPQGDCLVRQQLALALPGDFVVTEQNKNYSLVHVLINNQQHLLVEEISLPVAQFAANKLSWRNWVAQQAPGHTAWLFYEIDLTAGKITRLFSYSRQTWLNATESNSFLQTLLQLSFRPLSDSQRKKIGIPPSAGPDRRKVWNPPLYVDGKEIANPLLTAWQTQWPNDGSPLSKKPIDIYLAPPSETIPSFFPYWIEVHTAAARFHLRVVDSGRELPPPPLEKACPFPLH